MTEHPAWEANFDGLVGPTHNYGGHSFGNVASFSNKASQSNPREAALQGLMKMKTLADMGLIQGVLPPQERPSVDALRRLGFVGSDADVLARAGRYSPRLVSGVSSAAAMWVANAATVSPSADTADGRVHFTPANLVSKFHRSIEAKTTARVLRAVFSDERFFVHHAPLPSTDAFGDEGAANHSRFAGQHGDTGLELFVYGKRVLDDTRPQPRRYPARQTREASEAVARLHGLNRDRCVFIQQNPEVVDQGVFHNDVVAVGNGNVLLYHQKAFLQTEVLIDRVGRHFGERPFHFIEVADHRISVEDAVSSYLFNSQLLTLPDSIEGRQAMALILPIECQESDRVRETLEMIRDQDNPITTLKYFDLKQSMRNGGGPACLRLRVVLTKAERQALNSAVLLTDDLYRQLQEWVRRHYRDRLSQEDLVDPRLLQETRAALDELTRILRLGSVYTFQK